MAGASRARGLVDACHPGPTLAVTTVVTLLAAGAGRQGPGLVLVGAAVLTGQLSVGWSNDARDTGRDLGARRAGKPTVRGAVTEALLWRCATMALVATVVLSYLAAGPVGGTAHVLAVASAWSYNLWLKTTRLSWLPYAVSFGLVPAFVTYGLTPPAAPAPWAVAACALMGVGAHLANALPDVDGDTAVGAGGVVVAMGDRVSTGLSLLCLLAALALLALHLPVPGLVAALLVVTAVAGAVLVVVRGRGRALFRFVLVLAVVAVALLVRSAGALSS